MEADFLFGKLFSPVVIIEPDDVIFLKIFPKLDLNNLKGDDTGIPQPVPRSTSDERALALPEQFDLSIQFNFCSSPNNYPVFAPVMVQAGVRVFDRV